MKSSQFFLLVANMFIVGMFVTERLFTKIILMILAFVHIFLSWMAMKTETTIDEFKRTIRKIAMNLLFDIARNTEKPQEKKKK